MYTVTCKCMHSLVAPTYLLTNPFTHSLTHSHLLCSLLVTQTLFEKMYWYIFCKYFQADSEAEQVLGATVASCDHACIHYSAEINCDSRVNNTCSTDNTNIVPCLSEVPAHHSHHPSTSLTHHLTHPHHHLTHPYHHHAHRRRLIYSKLFRRSTSA